MRIKAFTLVEIIVVIVLIGIVYSLGISTFYNIKKSDIKQHNLQKIKEILPKNIAVFYSYSKECKKSGVILENGNFIKVTYPVFTPENIMLKKNRYAKLDIVKFEPIKLENRRENICIKIEFKNGNFTDKFILSNSNKYYLFLPFYQEIEEFKTKDEAINAYFRSLEYPLSKDGFYNE